MTGIEEVKKWVTKTNKPHWKVYYGSEAKTGAIAASSEVISTVGGNLDIATSIKNLNEFLMLLPNGDYLIQVKNAPQDNTGIFSLRFEIRDTFPGQIAGVMQQQNNPAANPNFVSIDQMNTLINARIGEVKQFFEKQELIRQIGELKKEIKDAKKGGGSDIAGLIREAIAGFNALRTMNNTGTTVAIAGANSGPVPQNIATDTKDHDNNEQANNNVERGQALRSIYDVTITEIVEREGSTEKMIEMLFCLNEWIKENPAMYETLKPTILKHKEQFDEIISGN